MCREIDSTAPVLKTAAACPLRARSSGGNREAAVTRGELETAATSSGQVTPTAE